MARHHAGKTSGNNSTAPSSGNDKAVASPNKNLAQQHPKWIDSSLQPVHQFLTEFETKEESLRL